MTNDLWYYVIYGIMGIVYCDMNIEHSIAAFLLNLEHTCNELSSNDFWKNGIDLAYYKTTHNTC